MHYHFKIHREDGYWAEGVELIGCRTQARTRAELERNLEEALDLYLEESADSSVAFPLPKKSVPGRMILKVKVRPQMAFVLLLRSARARRKWSEKQAAIHCDLKTTSEYRRLESLKNAELSFEVMSKVKATFPELSFDSIF